MKEVRFHNGTATIGGPSIEFLGEEERVIYGFGKAARNLNFTVPMDFRTLILEKYAPAIDGVYKKEYLDEVRDIVDLESFDEYSMTTHIFITHGHPDHMGLIPFLDERVELYVHQKAYELFTAVSRIENKDKDYLPKKQVNYYQPDVKISFSHMNVTPILIDHDTISPCSLKIEFDGINIVYTGDYYLIGKHPDWMDIYMERLKGVDVFITEATCYSFLEDSQILLPDPVYEEQLMQPSKELDGLTYASSLEHVVNSFSDEFVILFYPDINNPEYLLDCYQACKDQGVKMIVLPDIAFVLGVYGIFDISVLQTPQTKDLYDKLGLSNSCVTLEEVTQFDRVFLQINELTLSQTRDALKKKTKLFSWDFTSPGLKLEIKKQQIEWFDVAFTGHVSVANLLYVILQINPTQLMAIHSFKPEMLLKSFPEKAIASRKNYSYVVEKGKLVETGPFIGDGYLLSSDFDGTLYRHSQVDKEDVRAISNYMTANKSNVFMMNTGRTLPSLQRKMGEITPFVSYYSCSNGALVYDKEGTLLKGFPMEQVNVIKLFEYLLTLPMDCISGFDMQFDQFDLGGETLTKERLSEIKEKIEMGGYPDVYAMFLKVDSGIIPEDVLQSFAQFFEMERVLLFSETFQKEFLEIVITQKGIHKGSALNYVNSLEHKTTTIHMGDYYNDKGGFAYADQPFLIGEQKVVEGFRRVESVNNAIEILLNWR